jgi:magnesium chelatase family protein
MALARLCSATFLGLEALLVDVEVDGYESEAPGIVIVGLPDAAVKESKDRVLTAIKNSRFNNCHKFRFTINLAPGDLKKEGSLYDLPIALGCLACMQAVSNSPLLQDY